MADSIIAQLVPSSIGGIALATLLLLVGYQVSIYIYNIFLHPLRRFPGPIVCAASSIPIVSQDLKGDGVAWMVKLHERYGEVVRITPNELSFSGAEAYKDIHGFTKNGRTTLEKDFKFYMIDPSKPHSVINAPTAEHGRQRKIFANAFSDRALKMQEPLFLTYIDKLISKLRENPDKKHDLVRLYNYTAFDIIADLTFGESLGMLDNLDYHPFVASMLAQFRFGVYHHALNYWPAIKNIILKFCVPKSLIESGKVQHKFAREQVDARLEKEDARPDIWGLVLEKNQANIISKPEMYENADLFMVAGTETTSTALSGLTWLLLTNPDKLKKLVSEVRNAFVDEDEITVEKLQALPYLHACIEEGLRMYPPVPSGLPRHCPPGQPTVIDGYEVPGGTIVQVTNLCAFRNANNFSDPYKFVPERWLPHEPEGAPYVNDKRSALQPFSYGPNACLGKNMAYHEMRLILTKLVYSFDLKLCEESKDWFNQKVLTMWEKPELFVKVQSRQ